MTLVLVLVESCLIAILGGLAGLGAAWGILSAGIPLPAQLPMFFVPTISLIQGVGLAIALGLVAGILPAWQAKRLKISEALRRGA
jgi:putative ABC transport system permease protein